MRRLFPAFIVALLLVLPAAGGEDGLTGHWKFSFLNEGSTQTPWLIRLDSKDGKLTASGEPMRGFPKVKIDDLKQTGDTLQFKLKATIGKQSLSFDYEGKLPKPGAKKILGSVSVDGDILPAVLELTAAKTAFEVEREILQRTPSDPKALIAILKLIDAAEENKLDAKDLQELVDGSLKSGELFGPRYEMNHKLRLLKALSIEKAYPMVTLDTARKIVKQIDPKSPAANQLLTIASVAQILRAADHKDEADAITLETARRIVKQIDPKSPAASQLQIARSVAELLRAANKKDEADAVTLETARRIVKQIDPKSPAASQLQIAVSVAEILRAANKKDEAAAVTLDTARRIVKEIDEKSSPLTQLQTLASVADILRAGKAEGEVKALEARIENLEAPAHADYSKDALDFKIEKFAGRKGKSKRVVLVELFTGATCPHCIAADMGFDGLEKAYTDKEVVLLQYHMNAPQPEPMTNADNDARFEYYMDNYPKKVAGTPAILFNGKPGASGGGYREDAPEKYKEYCDVVNKLLESPAAVELAASAVRTGDKIAITAKVTGPDKADDRLRLRLALVEDWVRYKGSNGLQYHHRVVRALPGGIKGFTLKEKESEHKVTVELDELRRKLNKYLDEYYGPEGTRPMRLRNLHVVAFVQNDDTTEILQAIDVAVKDEK